MAYVALYRAYRPQRFDEVVGQKHIITTLQNAIKLNKVAHAYLFSGPRGTGKTSLAKILAKALNCEHGPGAEPCGECFICQGITRGTISDVIEIDAASNNGADDIRVIRDSVKFMPATARFKVYIIDEVHMLSNAAFNALLKTLEEPPQHVIFILATTEPYKLPATILSRCQRFDFQAITDEDIFGRLKYVCAEEKISATDEALALISQAAEGGMRDSLSLLDACVSYSTDDLVDMDDVLAVSGNVNSQQLLEIIKQCLQGDGAAVLKCLEEILKEGKEIPRFISDLILFLRDTLLYKNKVLQSLKGIYGTNEFNSFANSLSNQKIYKYLEILNELQNNIKFTNQKRAYTEVYLLKMCDSFRTEETVVVKKESIKPQPEPKKYSPPQVEKKPEIENIPEMNNEPQVIANIDEEVKVTQIEDILNNPNKPKKEFMTELFRSLEQRYVNDIALTILCQGNIVAATNDQVLVVLKDEGLCNRVMRYDSFEKIMKKINNEQLILKDYIAIPQSIWNLVLEDYMEQYKKGVLKPKLTDIRIPVKNHIKLEEGQNPIIIKAFELFEKDKIKIED